MWQRLTALESMYITASTTARKEFTSQVTQQYHIFYQLSSPYMQEAVFRILNI